jgi:hypothetical protein
MSSYEDKIWLDGNRKLDGICQDALEARAELFKRADPGAFQEHTFDS